MKEFLCLLLCLGVARAPPPPGLLGLANPNLVGRPDFVDDGPPDTIFLIPAGQLSRLDNKVDREVQDLRDDIDELRDEVSRLAGNISPCLRIYIMPTHS